ncbi:MAG TPA: hypothetical protein PLN21_08175 [Gemmatales bacterium]|nr:hypothetical protein [Gemmatales bacterium]
MQASNKVIYELAVRVRNSQASTMPSKYAGASVACYTIAKRELDVDLLIEAVASELEDQGLQFEKSISEVKEIELELWDNYIDGRWGDLPHDLPSATKLKDVTGYAVYFGPFACFEK